MAFRTRIRAVRFKSGGEVRLLKSDTAQLSDKCAKGLSRAASECLDLYEGEMAGFALVVWCNRGTSTAAVDIQMTSQINSSQVPGFVAERISRYFNAHDAEAEVKRILGIIPDEGV